MKKYISLFNINPAFCHCSIIHHHPSFNTLYLRKPFNLHSFQNTPFVVFVNLVRFMILSSCFTIFDVFELFLTKQVTINKFFQ